MKTEWWAMASKSALSPYSTTTRTLPPGTTTT